MVSLRRMTMMLAAMLVLLLFVSSWWLPHSGLRDCGSVWQPCLTFYRQTPKPPLVPEKRAEPVEPLLRDCPGQSFQAWRLLHYLKSSLANADDVLLEPYLQSWDQLLNFMESLGTVVGFFSQRVKDKVVLIRAIVKTTASFGPKNGATRSVRSMVRAELERGVVNFTRRTDSGCRTLLRLHRSLLWLKLMLEGLAEGPDAAGRYKTPGELSRDAYKVALAPHHSWVLRQAAEFVFLALPDREYFLQLVCVQSQQEATPILHRIIHALMLVHTRTQRILAEHGMLELP